MSLCTLCLCDLENISDICQDMSETNIHYSINCHRTKIYTTSCNHKFHKCCIYSYVWHETGSDCVGEIGKIKCPYCRQNIIIKIED
jgi:hypothetical protein